MVTLYSRYRLEPIGRSEYPFRSVRILKQHRIVCSIRCAGRQSSRVYCIVSWMEKMGERRVYERAFELLVFSESVLSCQNGSRSSISGKSKTIYVPYPSYLFLFKFSIQIVFPTLYVVIVYFMSDQPCEPMRFFMFLTMSVMTSLVAQSLGLVIGAAMEIQV